MGKIKVLVKSPFSIFSGYGQDGFGILRALHRWGCDVYAQPTWLDVPIPPDLLPIFAKPLVQPFDLTINHCSPDQLGLKVEGRRCTRLAVAWSMWEFSTLAPICKGRSRLRERLKWYDLVLGYDPVSLAALEPYIPRHVSRGVLLGGFGAANWPPVERDWFGDQFGFAMHGALNNRKQPMLVLQAFLELQAERPEFAGARLSFHTTIPPLFRELNDILAGKRVRVFMEAWDDATLKAFYAANHCLVYPSQGEGKNVPCLEFLATGGTVIHTLRGGPECWLRDDIGYTVPHTLHPLFPDKHPGLFLSARVELAALKDVMWQVYTHREEAKRKGELAAKLIPAQLSWDTVVEDLFRRIRDLCGHHGEVIHNLAVQCRREPEPW